MRYARTLILTSLHVVPGDSRLVCAGVHSNAACFPRTIAEGSVVSTSENRRGRSRFHWCRDSLEYAAVLAPLQIPLLSFRRAGGSITSQENGNIFTACGQIREQKLHQGFYVNACLVSSFVSTYVDDLYCVCPSETTLVLGIWVLDDIKVQI